MRHPSRINPILLIVKWANRRTLRELIQFRAMKGSTEAREHYMYVAKAFIIPIFRSPNKNIFNLYVPA